MDHQGKAVLAVGRHRADSEDGQRHDGEPPLSAPQQVPGDSSRGAVNANRPDTGAPELRTRNPSRRAATQSSATARSAGSPRSAAGSEVSSEVSTTVPKDTLRQGTARRNHELLGWGFFLTFTAAAAMGWAGIEWPVTAVCGFLLLLSFTAAWYVSTTPVDAPATAPAPEPAASEPQASEPQASAAVSAAASPAALPAPSSVTSPDATSAASSANPESPASPEPLASPVSPVAAAEAPMTRKQMRAADPSTGVLPVISVFARKPGPANGAAPAREATAPAAVHPVPSTPAGFVLQGIDPAPDSRRARRAADAGSLRRTSGAGTAGTVAVTVPAAAGLGDSDEDGDGDGDGESRWTRVFGPPETGQLPVQRYIAAASGDPIGAANTAAAGAGSPDRRQRSHSSL